MSQRLLFLIFCILCVISLVSGKIYYDHKIKVAVSIGEDNMESEITEMTDTDQSEEGTLISPLSEEWLYTNGTWKTVNVPGWGEQMQGWLNSKEGQQYGRRAHISTNSTFATLKQRGIGGKVSIFVDGQLTVEQELTSDGKNIEIPIYQGFTGWHTIDLVYSLNSEVNGLIISKDAEVKKPEYVKKKLLVIGHSFTEGSNATNIGLHSFVSLLGDNLDMETVNQGIGGTDVNKSYPRDKNNSGLDRVQADIIDEKPDYVLVNYGLNVTSTIDSGEMSLEEYKEDFITFLEEIRQGLPESRIFVSGIVSVPGWSDSKLREYNSAIEEAASTVENTSFISMSGYWNSSNYSTYISEDNVHPSDEGHKFLSEKYAEAIKEALE